MKPPVEVRPFLRRHLRRVMEIERACFDRDAYPRDLFLELYGESAGLFFVARRSRRIAGYSVTCAQGPAAELVSLAVAPEHRSAGVGTALLRHTIAKLRRKRVRKLVLTVRPANQAAIRLYRSFGFRAAGKIRRYYEDHTDALLMRKRLS
ncbi:MAG: ribosomal protein S18-alanine N-acetyltransferase [Acidobacteriota bacterium]